MQSLTGGLLLLIVASIANASFSLPMKYTRRWSWENTWLVWSASALLVLPVLAAWLTVPQLGMVYSEVPASTLTAIFLFGAGWGVAQVLFGLALDAIGIALTFSIVLGLSAAMGSLLPFLQFRRDLLFQRQGLITLAGIALVIAGVSISAIAGRMRDRTSQTTSGNKSFAAGLLLAIISGICASLMNVGISYGVPLQTAAASHGTKPYWLVTTIWVPLLAGGAVPNLLYCLYLLRKNKTGAKFSDSQSASHWLLAILMAILWFGSSLLYGTASGMLGNLGTVIGWPMFMSLIVITASVVGVLTGEWRNADRRALQVQCGAVLVLIVAVIVLSRAS